MAVAGGAGRRRAGGGAAAPTPCTPGGRLPYGCCRTLSYGRQGSSRPALRPATRRTLRWSTPTCVRAGVLHGLPGKWSPAKLRQPTLDLSRTPALGWPVPRGADRARHQRVVLRGSSRTGRMGTPLRGGPRQAPPRRRPQRRPPGPRGRVLRPPPAVDRDWSRTSRTGSRQVVFGAMGPGDASDQMTSGSSSANSPCPGGTVALVQRSPGPEIARPGLAFPGPAKRSGCPASSPCSPPDFSGRHEVIRFRTHRGRAGQVLGDADDPVPARIRPGRPPTVTFVAPVQSGPRWSFT